MPDKTFTEGELTQFLAQPKTFLSQPENLAKILGADAPSRTQLANQIAQRVGVDPADVLLNIGARASEYALIVYKSKGLEEAQE